ncbi:hypothetical protein ACFLQ1_01620 [Candidatus Auribacterota bacterium]
MQRATLIIIILISLVSYNVCAAYAGIDDVTIHGFISQGYLKTTNNNFIIENSKDGSAEFNEAGLNFSTEITDNLRGGLQLFSRDLGKIGNNRLKLDWGFLDYSLKDEIGLRVGKIKSPIGLYNQGRDVDLLRSSILLPRSVYPEDLRDIFVATNGLELYGSLPLSKAGSLEYELFYGAMSVEDNMPFFINLVAEVVGAVPNKLKTTIDYIVGAQFRWNTPINGLRLGTTFIRVDIKSNYSPIAADITLLLPNLYIISGEYVWENLTISSELTRSQYQYNNIPLVGSTKGFLEGYYTQASYRFFNWLEAGTYYSVYYGNKDDKKGDYHKALGLGDYNAWEKDWAIFARFDITDSWLIKLETHFVDGVAQGYTTYNLAGFKRKWKLYSVKTTFNF